MRMKIPVPGLLCLGTVFISIAGCSREQNVDPADLATPSEIPGGLAILDLTKDQAAKINEWEQQQESAPLPEDYFEFVKSLLRSDQQANFRSILNGDHTKVAQASIARLDSAAERYEADCGQYPDEVGHLSENPGITGWQGPYYREILDPWGIPYRIDIVDAKLKIWSSGPDRNSRTADDITN